MTRDEVLSAIKELSERLPSGNFDLAYRMREVARLADRYPDHADSASLADALSNALEQFAEDAETVSRDL